MSWKKQNERSFRAYRSGNASSCRLPDRPTAWTPFTWTEAVATDNSRTRAGARYPCTVTTQQLKINPIPASRGDLITEKWPRQIVARSSFSDVIIDLKIGGVKLTGTSLPLVGELTPERQSERCSHPAGIHLEWQKTSSGGQSSNFNDPQPEVSHFPPPTAPVCTELQPHACNSSQKAEMRRWSGEIWE